MDDSLQGKTALVPAPRGASARRLRAGCTAAGATSCCTIAAPMLRRRRWKRN
jgi:hypothetical protein